MTKAALPDRPRSGSSWSISTKSGEAAGRVISNSTGRLFFSHRVKFPDIFNAMWCIAPTPFVLVLALTANRIKDQAAVAARATCQVFSH